MGNIFDSLATEVIDLFTACIDDGVLPINSFYSLGKFQKCQMTIFMLGRILIL
jgi:hypothetical protein